MSSSAQIGAVAANDRLARLEGGDVPLDVLPPGEKLRAQVDALLRRVDEQAVEVKRQEDWLRALELELRKRFDHLGRRLEALEARE